MRTGRKAPNSQLNIAYMQRKDFVSIQGHTTFHFLTPDENPSITGHYYPVVHIIKGIQTIIDKKGDETTIVNAIGTNKKVYLHENDNPESVKYEDIIIEDGVVHVPNHKKNTIQFLRLCEQNVESMNRARITTMPPLIIELDNRSKAEEILNKEYKKLEALSLVRELSGKDLKDTASVFGLNIKESDEVLRLRLHELASDDPDFFINRINDDTLKHQAEIQGLITDGILKYDENTLRAYFTVGNKRTDIVQVPQSVDKIVFLADFLFMPDNKKTLDALRAKKK